ncbi:MAG: decaprenyl-phosphate phosphoribosyltransferase [Lachnoanaerobaculum saburreum]|jgi:prenyltransferase, ubiA family
MEKFKYLIKLLRPHQYVKNSFVLVGVLFSRQWDIYTLLQAAWAFCAFSLSASAVYILNDLSDIEADRAHPKKRYRPLPSGKVSITAARKLAIILFLVTFIPTLLLKDWILVSILLTYIVMNIAYSLCLKHIVLLDVFVISMGFMLRLLAGTWGIGIAPSEWLLLCGMMLTLFLGFCKRTSELLQSAMADDTFAEKSRRVLTEYNTAMLEQFTSITAACAIISFGLYTVSDQTIRTQGTSNLIYTLPLVIYGIFRYLFLLHRHGKGTDTAKDLFTDRHLLLTGSCWVAMTLVILICQ